MTPVLTILRKVIVNSFYRQNAGLLFVVLLMAGSFMRGQDHIALAEYAVNSPFLLGLYQVLWAAYTLHASRFTVRLFRENEVLYHLRLIPATRRFVSLFITQLLLLQPVLLYTAFVFWISLQTGTPLSGLQLLVGTIGFCLLPLLGYNYSLRHPNPAYRTAVLRERLTRWFTTPPLLFFPRYLLHRQPVLLFLTKGSTILLLLALLWLYPTDDYDIRLLALGLLVTALSHSTMLYQLYQFEHEQLVLLRNLPISMSKRILQYAALMALLLLPEALLLVRYQPATLSASNVTSVWTFGHSLLLVQFGLLLPRHRQLDQLLPQVFGLLIGYFFLIMYQCPLWVLSSLNWAGGSWLIFNYYARSTWETASEP